MNFMQYNFRAIMYAVVGLGYYEYYNNPGEPKHWCTWNGWKIVNLGAKIPLTLEMENK